MKKLTAEVLARIAKAIKESDDDCIAQIREEWGDTVRDVLRGLESEGELDRITHHIPGLEHVDTDCVAGDGSEAYCVFKDVDTGTHLGFVGWYNSYEGFDFGDYDLVPMKPFTVQHWMKAK